jgi:4-hydroxy-tetrahydrodipicolinate synthase
MMHVLGREVRSSTSLDGFIADLPTPFSECDAIDWPAFEMLCEHQIASGATAMVVAETMGEGSTLSRKEQGELIRAAVKLAHGRVAVIAGAGSNSTTQAIELSSIAEKAGADAILSVVPYYNKPMQAGILAHFEGIAASTGLPIVLHDIPSRTARSISDEVIVRLAESPRIIGLCDATGEVPRLIRLRSSLPSEFQLTCGGNADPLSYLASGGDGCFSSLANLFPDHCRDMHAGCAAGNLTVPRWASVRLAPMSALLAGEAPVATLKYALSLLGFVKPIVRLPLTDLDVNARKAVAKALTLTVETTPASGDGLD